ncbi:MAG TPA: TasA family protein [Bacilli bacterium]|nr:TasA family protein [Bacilli bacterium]
MNKKKWMLAAFGSVMAVGLAVGGSTYAIFTSSAQNTNNSFTAGTVDIEIQRDLGDTIPGPMFYTGTSDPTGSYPYDTTKNVPDAPPGAESLGGLAPGDQLTRAMNIFNRGSLDVRVKKLQATVNAAGETSGPAYDQFIQKMNVKVMYPAANKVLYDGPLAGLLSGYVDISPFLIAADPSGPANVTFTVTLDKSADNTLQGHSFVFDFGFYAEQKRNNP